MTRNNCANLVARYVLVIVSCCTSAAWAQSKTNEEVTWRRDIAPIVYKNCAGCHHTGGSGPFALITYADAQRWGSLMQTVTASRYMPPWLPEPGHEPFRGDRRLSETDIAAIRRWVQGGMKEGSGTTSEAPVYSSDWQLGPPDLVLEMTSSLQVPASGQDLFMNFALPSGVTGTKWVRAMEIKPGSPQLVHHANVIIDRTASFRRAHPDTWQQGVPGMDILVDSGESFDPDSHFLFWKPDSTALVEPNGMPWRLDAGNDLILNMHLKPTGKIEQVHAKVGLYFTDKPATEHPILLQLEHDDALDIPAGDKAFIVEDSLKLPVSVDVLGIYPHAHYLGKRMEGWATLPNGQRRWLIVIRNWDIDRQSVYEFARPVSLPKGTVIHMRYSYDNSADNVHNPNSPPIRVKAGNRSVDEMGHLWLQVLPKSEPGSSADRGRMALERAWMENRLSKDPHDPVALYNLGSLAMMEGDGKRAVQLYRQALELKPDDVRTITSIGSAMAAEGDWRGAQAQYGAALARDPRYVDAAFDLAAIDLKHAELARAEALFHELTGSHPEDAEAHSGLAATLAAEGKTAEAQIEFQQTLKLDPHNFDALYGLGKLAADTGNSAAAEPLLVQALKEKKDADAERLLALTFADLGDNEKALAHLQAWERLAPSDAEPHRALAQVYRSLARMPDALREQHKVVEMEPRSAADWNDLGVMEAQNGDRAAARKEFEHALALEPRNVAAKANLAKVGASLP